MGIQCWTSKQSSWWGRTEDNKIHILNIRYFKWKLNRVLWLEVTRGFFILDNQRRPLSGERTFKLKPKWEEGAGHKKRREERFRQRVQPGKKPCSGSQPMVHGQEGGQYGQRFMSKEVSGIWTQKEKPHPDHRWPCTPALGLEFYSMYNGKPLWVSNEENMIRFTFLKDLAAMRGLDRRMKKYSRV